MNISNFLSLFEGFPSPTETIRRAAVLLRENFQAESVSLLLYSKSRRSLVFQYVSGGSETQVGRAIPEGVGIAWWAVESGYTIIHDCGADLRFSGRMDSTSGFVNRNMVAVPFGHEGQSMGVIELVNLSAETLDAPATEAHVKFIAGVIGVAYSAALLQTRLQLQKSALETANLELEQRVAERTQALNAALSDLQDKNDLLGRTQSTLVQTEKMAALGQLAAGVAHEINNPIGFISSNLCSAKSYWQNLREYIARLNDASSPAAKIYREKYDIDMIEDDMQRLLEECLEGTSRVTSIVRNLKEFAHQGHNETKRFNVHELMDRTLAIALSPFKHRVEILKDYRGRAEIVNDGQKFGQVLLNLAVNAAQSITGTGRITLRTFEEAGRFVIEVEDTGCGIPAENLTKIFEPFFTTKAVGVGTGLGLSTCFHLVQQSGGDISVKSEVGRGTTIRLSYQADAVSGV